MGINTERELLQQLASGDDKAFRVLYDSYSKPLYAFIHTFTHSHTNSEEILQDTFLVLWKNRGTLDKVESPKNYIYTIARNKTLDYLSRAAKEQKVAESIWSMMKMGCNATEEAIDEKDTRALISNALGQMSEQKQLIFQMSRFEGKSHEEIAQATGLSKSRVKNVIVESLKFVKLHLEKSSLTIQILAWLTINH